MENQEQVELLKQGVEAWNTWRQRNVNVQPDLSGADLSNVDLDGANLSETNLSNANLTGARLFEAHLNEADLSEAHLFRADLRRTYLWHANLSGADLCSADLSEADLSEANLRSSDLSQANLFGVDFSEADLSGADLKGASFIEANLHLADFHAARLFCTTFAWVDLRAVEGLDTIIHEGPSTINVNTVNLPEGEIRSSFLRGAGFSNLFIDSYASLFTSAGQYESCFLSYAPQDEALARRLYQDLQGKGVRCWLTPHHLGRGTHPLRGIDDALHFNESVLLLLSEHAIGSTWIMDEVETILNWGNLQQRNRLIPLQLDNAVIPETEYWVMRLRGHGPIEDFTRWQDNTIYQQHFAELLRRLEVKTT
jgi:uncharacterized protein YjbI with pentapeptide repeats